MAVAGSGFTCKRALVACGAARPRGDPRILRILFRCRPEGKRNPRILLVYWQQPKSSLFGLVSARCAIKCPGKHLGWNPTARFAFMRPKSNYHQFEKGASFVAALEIQVQCAGRKECLPCFIPMAV